MQFYIHGHENVLCSHKTTIEFTKDTDLTKNGDCILGVKADFDYDELIDIVQNYDKIKVIVGNDEIIAYVNKDFDDGHEIVIRKSDFKSKRTLGIKANKAAIDIDRQTVERLKDPTQSLQINITGC